VQEGQKPPVIHTTLLDSHIPKQAAGPRGRCVAPHIHLRAEVFDDEEAGVEVFEEVVDRR
jgi:hypothetical protein